MLKKPSDIKMDTKVKDIVFDFGKGMLFTPTPACLHGVDGEVTIGEIGGNDPEFLGYVQKRVAQEIVFEATRISINKDKGKGKEKGKEKEKEKEKEKGGAK